VTTITYTSPSGVTYDVLEIPTQPVNQQFTISLGGVTYDMRLKWNAPNQSWILDILDSQQNAVLEGLPLITGADLLAQYKYVGIAGSLVVQSDYDPDVVPDYETLGSTGHLYYLPPESA
jgi:Domain of unknown function (DUF6983)